MVTVQRSLRSHRWRREEHALRRLCRRLGRHVDAGDTLELRTCGPPRLQDGVTLVDVAGMLRLGVLRLPHEWRFILPSLQKRGAQWGVTVEVGAYCTPPSVRASWRHITR